MKSTPSYAPLTVSSERDDSTAVAEALNALGRGLTRSRGFTLFLAVCNKPAERAELIRLLRSALPELTLHQVVVTPDATDLLAEVVAQAPEPKGPILIEGLERVTPSDRIAQPILEALNLQRPEWPRHVPQPIVLWVPEFLLALLSRHAPDFLDWRTDTFHFPELADEQIEPVIRDMSVSLVEGRIPVAARQERMIELRQRLAETVDSMDAAALAARANTLVELARSLSFVGEPDAAMTHLKAALAIYEASGDKRSRAVTLGDIARIRAAKGEVDAALQLHQERLGIFEALGDLDGKANTLWSIAQIEIQQEKWQEAFNHFSESYAINLKLGRLDGICMVGLDLGQLLCMAGNRDEGLKILTRSRDGFTKLGQTQMAQQTQALMEQISKLPPPQPE